MCSQRLCVCVAIITYLVLTVVRIIVGNTHIEYTHKCHYTVYVYDFSLSVNVYKQSSTLISPTPPLPLPPSLPHVMKETSELQKKQVWYQEHQNSLSRDEEEQYIEFCREAMFRIHILEQRLTRHKALAPHRYREMEQCLRADMRLVV